MLEIADCGKHGGILDNPWVHLIGIGLGLREHLTFGAEQQLVRASRVYMMAAEDSWMVQFVGDIVGKDKVRTYMPASVKWNSDWQHDAIFKEVSDEVCALVEKGQHIAFAMAGDVAIYGNVADSIIPIFRKRGLQWDVFPGVSFLNAISMVTGEPIVGEADNFVVTFAQSHAELDEAFSVANVLVLYNPGGLANLHGYIESRKLGYARMVIHGVYGSKALQVDLIKNRAASIKGLVILKRPQSFAQQAIRDTSTVSSELAHHIGANGWNSKQKYFATCYPNKLMWAPTGNPERLVQRFVFPDNPDDVRGFFIDSQDVIYVSLKGHRKGAFGRTYLSRDSGKSFELAFEKCCWSFDEDRHGNLYAGVYHEKGEPSASCSVLWSIDGGRTWVDIASEKWYEQNHVHHIAIDPSNGWLYASLGDKLGLRGCWRTKIGVASLAKTAQAGATTIFVSGVTGDITGDGAGTTVYLSSGTQAKVDILEGGEIKLKEPLARGVNAGERLLLIDWRLKVSDADNTLQFVGAVFKSGDILLANDTAPKGATQRVIVYKAHDDGSDATVEPVPVLEVGKDYGWGCFYLEMDAQGRTWAALRPIMGRGAIWVTDEGKEWELVDEIPEEDLPCWRGTHTLRDGTLGKVGDGRNLSAPNAGMVFPELSRSRLFGRNPNSV